MTGRCLTHCLPLARGRAGILDGTETERGCGDFDATGADRRCPDRRGRDLTQEAVGWKEPDAYFARANILLDNGERPSCDLVLGPGDVLTLGAVFAVPSGHNAAAYLVVVNSFTVSRRWLRLSGRW